jgi:hypothetical protein
MRRWIAAALQVAVLAGWGYASFTADAASEAAAASKAQARASSTEAVTRAPAPSCAAPLQATSGQCV